MTAVTKHILQPSTKTIFNWSYLWNRKEPYRFQCNNSIFPYISTLTNILIFSFIFLQFSLLEKFFSVSILNMTSHSSDEVQLWWLSTTLSIYYFSLNFYHHFLLTCLKWYVCCKNTTDNLGNSYFNIELLWKQSTCSEINEFF